MYKLIVLSLLLVPLSACMSTLSGDSYSREEARAVHQIEFAIVEGIRPVVLEGTKTPIGGAVGGVLGGIAGSSVGGGRGQAAGAVVGATVGAIAGAIAEERATRKQADEITLRKENGQIISLVQERSENIQFNIGDRVRILRSNGILRVAP
ncbi:MAG: glycine zipper 2TM domain-containing protein [Mariprofundaceae bacterium]|nr:glycine zipper 2TM domain-containing protein [Mariprofundaceae bacterium]